MTQNDTAARTIAGIGLLGIALTHILEAPDAFADAGYIGGLFVASVVGSVVLSAVLTSTDDTRAWTAAGGLAALVLLGYILSRTTGLPGFTDYVGVWDEPLGLASMVAEGLVVCVAGCVLAPSMQRSRARSARGPEMRRPAAQS